MRWGALIVGIVGCLTISSCSSSSSSVWPSSSATITTSTTISLSASRGVWLCRPDLANDPCESSETATVVSSTGDTTQEFDTPSTDPKIDCFYVYPTVSGQKTAVSNLVIGPEERAIAVAQASRFAHVCRVFAPMYRQVTLKALLDAAGNPAQAKKLNFQVGYPDVLAAWNDYRAHDNNGRGVVFIGHSQGAALLVRLLREKVDPIPSVRRLLVSAVLLGGNVTAKRGTNVGGDFQHIPACRTRSQTGCVIAYSSFLQAPPADSLFGRPGTGPRAGAPHGSDLQVLCVNPASPAGGSALVTSYFGTSKFPGLLGRVLGPVPKAKTPWVSYRDRYTAQCKTAAGATWLQITPQPSDTRPAVTQTLGAAWGLHFHDFDLALGDLVNLVGRESAAFHSP